MNQHSIAESQVQFDRSADVLVLQKTVDTHSFGLARGFPGRVVYDVDDVIDHSMFMEACQSADIITADTEVRAAHLRLRLYPAFRAKRVEVIPDALDYEGSGPRPVSIPDDPKSVVWFGNYPNFESATWMFRTFAAADVSVGAISDISRERATEWGIPELRLTAWAADMFPAELRKWGAVALSHRGADPFKSVNKMAAAYHLGVPCIVSGSDAYKQLADEAGLDWTYVQDIGGLFRAWERLQDPTERTAAIERVQPIVWEKYRAEAVARRALEVYAAA